MQNIMHQQTTVRDNGSMIRTHTTSANVSTAHANGRWLFHCGTLWK